MPACSTSVMPLAARALADQRRALHRKSAVTVAAVAGADHKGQVKTESFHPPSTAVVFNRCLSTMTGKNASPCTANQFAPATEPRFSFDGFDARSA